MFMEREFQTAEELAAALRAG
ncbi:MAG: hypothetical protein QOG10_3439, partial [Kribbellaceae bacterium]|nr:hypothetical protein [Kribbellaceae bacterium]